MRWARYVLMSRHGHGFRRRQGGFGIDFERRIDVVGHLRGANRDPHIVHFNGPHLHRRFHPAGTFLDIGGDDVHRRMAAPGAGRPVGAPGWAACTPPSIVIDSVLFTSAAAGQMPITLDAGQPPPPTPTEMLKLFFKKILHEPTFRKADNHLASKTLGQTTAGTTTTNSAETTKPL